MEQAVELELPLRVARFSVIECDRTEATRITLLILADLKKNIASTVSARAHSEDNWMITIVLDRPQSRRVNNSILQLVDDFQMSRTDLKKGVFTSELDKRTSDEGIALDEDTLDTASPEKSPNFGDGSRDQPVLDNFGSGRVNDSSLVVADVTEDIGLRDSDKGLFPTEGSAICLDSLDDTVH